MNQPIVQVDAFADGPFTGNPAAVCVMANEAESDWMQKVAMEMNLSETAFTWPDQNSYRIRWFTPNAEVDLCGHATLATAHVLWTAGHTTDDAITFSSNSGPLTATKNDEWISLDFPSEPPIPLDASAEIASVFDEEAMIVGRKKNRFDLLVEFKSEEAIRAFDPDFSQLAKLECRGIIITAQAHDKPYDFISRFFAPRCGVNEDPVTGSAHCCLAPYWSDKLGKKELVGYQASKRGGIVRVRQEGERTLLSGKALTVLHGELFV